MRTLFRHDAWFLATSIITAFLTRFLALFVGRPEFVGWFNHSPYYWVQSKALIEQGELAYGDMPLLFALYAGLAKLISLFGMPQDSAIIMMSRLVMVTTPALIPIAVYLLAKQTSADRPLGWPGRCLVLASGFLPLTFANMPEHLQKNMLGLLLLAFLLLTIFYWLRSRSYGSVLLGLSLLISIGLTHLGSALAALLLLVALAMEITLRRSSLKELGLIGLLCMLAVIGVGFAIHVFDPESTERVLFLLTNLIPDSSVELLVGVLVVSIWLGVVWFAQRWFTRRSKQNQRAVVALGRIIIVWIGLLAFPLWPGEIGMRLILFIPLAAVVLLVLFAHSSEASKLLRFIVAATTLVFVVMSIGEATSLLMSYPNKAQTSSELAAVNQKYQLSRDDLVITTYGAAPIANWFLGTRATLLTAVEDDVFERYDRVFVLNTLERPAPTLEPEECRRIQSSNDRYWATRHDTPMSEIANPDPDFERFDFFRLPALPENWVFDRSGLWAGWGDCTERDGDHRQ
ncbi:MAG: hypothetical protein AAF446_05560 [Pseudomonadota bacterium]